MPGARRKRRRFAGNHQQSWLYGRHAIEAMLAGDRWRPAELYVADDAPPLRPEVAADLAVEGLAVETVTADRLAELCGSREHQGAAARMPPYPYLGLTDLLAAPPRRLIVLDRIQYANNFGTILRSAEAFGFDACLVTDRGQCGVTAAIGRMSAGAVFHVPVCQVESLATAIVTLRADGLPIWSTDPEGGQRCDAADLTGRVGVVIGAEHDGVSPGVTAVCDGTLLIPQQGRTQSLNASSSASVLMYEAMRQQSTG